MANTILYVAFHYPPILGSSGVHRTLAFTRYLSEQQWDVTVLTSSLSSYDNWSKSQLNFIPEAVNVINAFGRNTAKQLSIKGKYLSWMALPDNWQSWIIGGVVSGLLSIWKNKPNIIVSTYPIASAHIIAFTLHKITGIPWVADLRDPMAQDGYPSDPTKMKIFQWIEHKIVKHCSNAIVTTPGAKLLYEERFPHLKKDFWQVIPNGFDEKMFADIAKPKVPLDDTKFVLLHSGVIYPSERDPSQLFSAIAELFQEGTINKDNFELKLRATGHDELLFKQLNDLRITELVHLLPAIPFKNALEEMYTVDGLLLLQADNCNYQIPAKAYEYIKVQKPVLALTPSEGDTGKLLQDIGLATIAPLDNRHQIKQALFTFLTRTKESGYIGLKEEELFAYSRQFHAKHFESLLLKAKT